MKVVSLYIEHPIMELNTTFSYLAKDEDHLERGMRVKVDFNGQKIIGFVDKVESIDSVKEYEAKMGYQLKMIDEIIDNEALLNQELYNLGLWMSYNTVSPVISCFQAMLPASLKPMSTNSKPVMVKWVKILDQQVKDKTEIDTDELPLKQFMQHTTPYWYHKWRNLKMVEVYEKQREGEYDLLEIKDDPYPLTEQQINALKTIETTDKDVVLLHGLTGTGKTEVYLQLVKKAVQQGKQCLILVPEISLTPMMVKRFKDRFSNVAIYHSGLNSQQKYEQYQLVRSGKVQIVVGTRSAIFMPFKNIGLIVLDEEHDNSYKQDSSPKYNTRDIAIQRGKTHNCKVVLGSATPTLESYARAIKNVYQLVTMDKRIGISLPKSRLVDMNYEMRSGNYIISGPLQSAMKESLDNNKQVILLLNRRGYTPIMKCGACGHVVCCPHCDVTLSYHKDEDKLICHSCGYSQSSKMVCPECGKERWRNYGLGTQRLAEEVNNIFPEAKVARMDADTTKVKDAHSKILNGFANKEFDVLVGTQMISKGLDFPDVTLVGVFNADAALAHSDYRSVETTYDLIVQASGRSGRSTSKGEVIIQGNDISHYGIRLAVKQDYITFFNSEMNYRHVGKYPPYTYMIAIMFASENEEKVNEAVFTAASYFREDEDLRVLGPSKLLKKKDEHRYRIVLKATNKEMLLEKVWGWYNKQQINRRSMRVVVDVDPYVLD